MNSFHVCILVGCSFLSTSLIAKEVSPLIGVNAASHSNIKKTSSSETESLLLNPYVGIKYEDANPQYETSIDFRLDSESYSKGGYSTQSFFKMDGYVDWIIKPGRFTLSVEDYAGRYRINIQDPDTPDNAQTVNVFAVGPDFLFSRNEGELLVKLRLTDVLYSEAANDNTRLIGAASLSRDLNSYSSLSIDSTFSTIDYDSKYINDYNMITTGVRYSRDLPYGEFRGSVGYNGFHFDSRADKNDPYYDANFKLELGGGSSIDLITEYRLTDLALEAFDPLHTRLLPDLEYLTDETVEKGAAGVYRATHSSGSYTYAGNLFALSFYGYTNKQNYFPSDANNLTESGIGINGSYAISEQINLFAGFRKSNVEYLNAVSDNPGSNNIGFDVDSNRAHLSASYNVKKNLFTSFGINIDNNDSEEIKRDYDDVTYWLNFEYRPKTSRAGTGK